MHSAVVTHCPRRRRAGLLLAMLGPALGLGRAAEPTAATPAAPPPAMAAPVPSALPATAPTAAAAAPVDLRQELRHWAQEETWLQPPPPLPLNRAILVASVEAARQFYLRHQRSEGNFNYLYDAVQRKVRSGDNAVRQAGALWGLALLCRDRPTVATRAAAIRGLDFFFRLSEPIHGGGVAPRYPGQDDIETGMVALTCLAIIDFVRGQDKYLTEAGRGLYDQWLNQYLNYLHDMELGNGSWGETRSVISGQRNPDSSPYADGEALLAYCRAARYLGRKDLVPRIQEAAPQLVRKYTVEAWDEERDSELTKGFYQWGCMAFAEYVEAGWADADLIADAAMSLTWWALYQHRVPMREANTGYAVEGLLSAYRIARHRGDRAAMDRIRGAVEPILARLISWQIGGPLKDRNPFLATLRPDPLAEGGIMGSSRDGLVRIDVVQHQLHAMLLALDLLYPENTATPAPRPATP